MAKRLVDKEPDRFVGFNLDDTPPGWSGVASLSTPLREPNPDLPHLSMMADRVRPCLEAGKNVILPCDLQSLEAHGRPLVEKLLGLKLVDPDLLIVRLEVSVEVAVSRDRGCVRDQWGHSHGESAVRNFHSILPSPPWEGVEESIDTNLLGIPQVESQLLTLIRRKWPCHHRDSGKPTTR